MVDYMEEERNNKIAEEALKYLWKHEPHALDKFKKLYENSGVKAPLSWIVSNKPWDEWSKEERIELIKIYEYDMNYMVSFKNRNDKDVKHLLITNYKLNTEV